MKRNIPQIYLEQLYLEELSAEKVKKINKQYPETQVVHIEKSNRDILAQYPPSDIKEGILRKLNNIEKPIQKKNHYRNQFLRFTPIAAALIFLTLNLSQIYQADKFPDQSSNVRPKGLTPSLSVFIDNGKKPVELFNNDIVNESDIIQLTYNAAGKKFGVIFSIDSRGLITLHYPQNKNDKPVINPDGSHALPFSYELDDAPGFERFFFISSSSEFKIADVLRSANRSVNNGSVSSIKSLDLPSGFNQDSIILRKDN